MGRNTAKDAMKMIRRKASYKGRVMVHPSAKQRSFSGSSYYVCAEGVHHSAPWCWKYVGGNPTCEPGRVFLQILTKGCHIRPHFEGKEKDPPYLASLFPELMSL